MVDESQISESEYSEWQLVEFAVKRYNEVMLFEVLNRKLIGWICFMCLNHGVDTCEHLELFAVKLKKLIVSNGSLKIQDKRSLLEVAQAVTSRIH